MQKAPNDNSTMNGNQSNNRQVSDKIIVNFY